MHDFNDWLAICNVKATYCRLLDTKDWEGWAQLFTEGFHQDVSGSGGGVYEGRDAAVAATRAAIETTKTAHQVHSPEIVITGDTATAIWALQDRLIWDGGNTMTGYGHYHEDYVKQDGHWRISRQRLTRLFMEA